METFDLRLRKPARVKDTLAPRGAALAAVVAVAGATGCPAQAQDIARGRELFSELPASPAQGSCIACHGNPAFNVNNILSAAGDPNRLVRTTNTVSAMGFLRAHLGESEIVDITAYLASVVPEGNGANVPTLLPHVDHFGVQPVGVSARSRTLVVENRTSSALAIGAVLSSRPQRFPAASDCPPVLAVGASCMVSAGFTPGFGGNARALVSIVAPDGRTLRSTVLSGSGTTAASASLDWLSTSTTIDFGHVVVGSAPSVTVPLANPGTITARVDSLRILGPQADAFTLTQTCTTIPVSPGGSCPVEVRFRPDRSGDAQAWIEVVADASSPRLMTIRGSASGEAPAPSPAPPPPSPPPPAAPTPPPAPSPSAATTQAGGGALAGSQLAVLGFLAAAVRALSRAPAGPGDQGPEARGHSRSARRRGTREL